MKLLRVTLHNTGEAAYLNPDRVVGFFKEPGMGYTTIGLSMHQALPTGAMGQLAYLPRETVDELANLWEALGEPRRLN